MNRRSAIPGLEPELKRRDLSVERLCVHLADRHGIHRKGTTLVGYMRGERRPQLPVVVAIADVLGCTVEDLLTARPSTPAAIPA